MAKKNPDTTPDDDDVTNADDGETYSAADYEQPEGHKRQEEYEPPAADG